MPDPVRAASRGRLAGASIGEAASAAPSPACLVFLRGKDADGRIQRLVAERRRLRPVLGGLALPLVARSRYEPLGFRSLGDWARERLGVTAHVVREWARVAEALAVLPALRSAVLAGEVSWSVARRAVAHASPEIDAAFAEALRGRTVQAAQELLRAAFGDGKPEKGGVPGEDDPAERIRVSVPLPAEHQSRWFAAVELARRVAGEALPVWECAEAIAAEALSALPPAAVAEAAEGLVAGSGAASGIRGDHTARQRAEARAAVRRREMAREHGLRAEAFPVLRWDLARDPNNAQGPLERLAAWAKAASPHALDRALRKAMRRLQRLDHDLGHLLRQVLERRLYREMGFASFERYAEERADLSPRTARRLVRRARLGPVGSAVAEAIRSGRLSARQAEVIASTVPLEQQAAAVTFARGVTLRRLEDEHGCGSLCTGAVTFMAPPEAATVFRLAIASVQRHTGAASPSEALVWVLDHAIATWEAHGARFRDTADFTRDGFRCTVPGCTARRSLQSHHIVFRSAGGPDVPWNRTTLCAFHHLRGIHAGSVSCRGRAPEGLVFALGLRPAGPPLLRAAAGDVLLGA